MSSDRARRGVRLFAALLGLALLVDGVLGAQGQRRAPRFYPDDPIAVDDDSAFDAGGAREIELSETFDFLSNTFGSPGDAAPVRAVNVNTIDEVPDSSWFTNRIGVRDMPLAEIRRGPNKFERLDAEDWIIVSGKGPGGFHPGFRAVHPGDPDQIYQLEVDPPDHPQMASGAEIIGTLIYHALGYHVVDVYPVRIDPARITISEKATIRDASGRRRFTRQDLDGILRIAARDRQGRVYFSASRFEEGKDLGHFQYYGTRSDDPNDIHPHEHRRELRANRVFSAWLAHDDSRAVNSLNMLVEENGRRFIRHYMYDFGAILGSATRFPDTVASGHEYYIDKDANLRALATLGLRVPRYARANYPDMPPSAGFVSSVAFDPAAWKPNYPNPAYRNMRPDDAFWGARLVARFSDEIIGAIVGAVGYDDPRAAEYLTRTIAERRDKVLRTWLPGVNPVVDARLAEDGTLTFTNAAVAAGVASQPSAYVVNWSRFDNDTGTHTPVGGETRTASPAAKAPPALLEGSRYIAATIRTEHPDHPVWNQPVQVYFRRAPAGWQTVGLFRE
ncbi:MAG TPA: hypothetical protein VM364_22260 [Vicinamibacterales bacterium]|nr:hypothetical protein [Vicinamibacterales bacterium]